MKAEVAESCLRPRRGVDAWIATLDCPSDTVLDADDNCPGLRTSNINDADGNGIGDMCECGDQNEDGTVDVLDIIAINNWLFGIGFDSPLCDADNSGGCTPNEILAVNLKIYGHEGGCARYPNP
jgi:hypothetical protein